MIYLHNLKLISTVKVILTRATNTAKGPLVEVSSTWAVDVLRTQKTVAMEVSAAVEGIGEKTRSCALETVWTFNAICWHAISSPEDQPNGASIKCWEQNSHWACLCHANVVDVRIQWPRAHVTDVVACELISTASLMAQTE